jgi:DHA1 family inner membrane transport protein
VTGRAATGRAATGRAAPNFPIALLAVAGFASGAGIRLLDPLLPLVAAGVGITVATATIVVAAFMLPYGLGQLITGPLGDRFGKVRVACFALFLYGLAQIACAFALGLGPLIAFRAMAGLFAGAIIPLLLAHIGDTVPYEARQETIGRFLTGMVMAQMLTGPISGVIGEFTGWRGAFVVLGVLALGVSFLIASRFADTLWHAPAGGGGHGQGIFAFVRMLAHPPGRRLLIAAFFDGFLLFGGAFPYVGSFLIQQFGLSAAHSGLVVAGFGVGAFVYTRLARRLIKAMGEGGMLLVGGTGLALGIALLAVVADWHAVVAIQLLLGLLFYMFHGVLQARATEVMPEARGTAVAAFALALFLGQTAGSLGFGAMLALASYRIAFAAIAAGVLLLAVWTWGAARPIAVRRGVSE